MKTIDRLSKYFPIVTISLILLASTLDAGAQNHRNKDKKGNERNHDRKEYKQADRNEGRTANHEWGKQNDRNRDNRNYESRDNRSDHHSKYSKKNNYVQRNYYNHPQYGRVYNRFDCNPIVFENTRGNYYYFGNHFYRYQRGIGYYVVEAPRSEYFSRLPVDYRRVQVNGNVFFRNGDVFFQLSHRGYRIVPSPIEVQFSVRF
ncbi:MAG TPA: DUF6515 family protein [Prolixibacteraceae bacterium]|nr:DUF6515 family protein [Prolixibacteraceae bacterium]